MTDVLKPCPFCGGESYLRDDVSHSTAYFIGCSTVDCFGEIHWGQTETEAVDGWNRRADLSAAAIRKARKDALREAAAIADEEGWGNFAPGLGFSEREEGSKDCADRIYAAIKSLIERIEE